MNDMPRHWKPLRKMQRDEFHPVRQEVVAVTMKDYNLDEAAARKLLDDNFAQCDYYTNHLYQVQAGQCGPGKSITHLCIRRLDGSLDLRDWRHFQQIKNEICGENREGFELYPRESRKVDTSNKFHIWVLPEDTDLLEIVGWKDRDVQYEENKNVPGLRQRPL